MSKNRQVVLTEGPILKALIALALPIMATSFLNTFYSITDMAWIGMLGSRAVAGVGVGGMYVWLSQGIGVKMLVLADGNCIGTIGGGCMESAVLQKALLLLRSDDTQARICQADLTGNDAEDEGMVCGGMVDVLLEVIE